MTQPAVSRRTDRHPNGYQPPARLPALTLSVVLPLLPRLRCRRCGGKITLDPPGYDRGRLSCLGCAAEFNEVVLEACPPPPRPAAPEPLSIQAERQAAYRERLREASRARQERYKAKHRCPDCGTRPVSLRRTRCKPCSRIRSRTSLATIERFVAVLRSHGPLRAAQVAPLVGASQDDVRRLARKARLWGIPIVYAYAGRQYQLETPS